MAEMQFEDDLRAMFDAAPAAADAAQFAARVDRRIVRRQRMGLVLISVLGLAGLAIAFLMFRPSLGELGVSAPSSLSLDSLSASASDIGLWSVGIVVLTLGWAGLQLVSSET